MDKDLFKEDDLLGLGAISVKELIVSFSYTDYEAFLDW
jgi:hypothetical protein